MTDIVFPSLCSTQGEKTVRTTKTTTLWICPSVQSRRKVGLICQARHPSLNTGSPEWGNPREKRVCKYLASYRWQEKTGRKWVRSWEATLVKTEHDWFGGGQRRRPLRKSGSLTLFDVFVPSLWQSIIGSLWEHRLCKPSFCVNNHNALGLKKAACYSTLSSIKLVELMGMYCFDCCIVLCYNWLVNTVHRRGRIFCDSLCNLIFRPELKQVDGRKII